MNKPASKEKMLKKKEIVQFAKNLYLTPDEADSSKHKYSFREIVQKIVQKMDTEISHNTIANWAKKDDWNKLWTQGQRHGIQEALKVEHKDSEMIDEVYESRISTQVAKQLKQIDDNTSLACEIINNELTRILQEQKEKPDKKLSVMHLKVISDIAVNGNEILNEKESDIKAPTLIQINVDVADDAE